MNAKAKRNKARKQLEAKIVKDVNDVEAVETLNQVFIYDELNVHSVQSDIWGEAKNGLPYTAEDFEMIRKGEGVATQFVAEKRMGERISGKLYQLTDEQLEATEKYYDELRKYAISDTVILFGEK